MKKGAIEPPVATDVAAPRTTTANQTARRVHLAARIARKQKHATLVHETAVHVTAARRKKSATSVIAVRATAASGPAAHETAAGMRAKESATPAHVGHVIVARTVTILPAAARAALVVKAALVNVAHVTAALETAALVIAARVIAVPVIVVVVATHAIVALGATHVTEALAIEIAAEIVIAASATAAHETKAHAEVTARTRVTAAAHAVHCEGQSEAGAARDVMTAADGAAAVGAKAKARARAMLGASCTSLTSAKRGIHVLIGILKGPRSRKSARGWRVHHVVLVQIAKGRSASSCTLVGVKESPVVVEMIDQSRR